MRVLLIEDDTMLAESICECLEQSGFSLDQVGAAGPAESALISVLRRSRPSAAAPAAEY